jgi:hypothetical protein
MCKNSGNPELILHNGRIYPWADGRVPAEAVAVWNGRVTDVGSDSDVLRQRARSVEVVDLRRQAVIPGMSDSHIHLLSYGMLLQTVDLTGTLSVRDVQKAVQVSARRRLRDGWIIGRGWDQEKVREHRYLNRADLNQFGSHPVFLKRVCGHVAVANDRALSLSGIGVSTPDPEGGEIVRDPVTGEPTGLLKESAIGLVERAVPRSEAKVRSALVEAARRLLRLGLTSLHCIVEDALEFRVLHQLKNEGRIAQSIYAILPLGLLDEAVRMGMTGDRDSNGFRVGGFKVYLDGSMGARTAALFKPYSDEPGALGMLRMTLSDLAEAAAKVSQSGFQLCTHAIGDRAVGLAVAALEKTARRGRGGSLRHRIEHASITPPRLITRMKRVGVVASVQPRFIYSDTWAGKRLGPRRLHHLYPFRSMLNAGLKLAFGSDCPVEDPNPFEGVWSAVARPGLSPSQSLSVPEALGCYTTGAAFASFSEANHGTLEPGKMADMVVLDRDPFNCSYDALRRIKAVQTFVGGKLLRP